MTSAIDLRPKLIALSNSLPDFACVASFETQEERARSVAAWFAAHAARLEQGTVSAADPLACPNCDQSFFSLRTPYCSDPCKEHSAFVRQFRSALTNGMLETEERQVALGQKLWRLLGGGLPLRVGLIPERALARILARNDGKCENCGLPAKHVDHIGTG